MPKMWDVLGVGSSAVDDLLFVERFPRPDEKMAVLSKQRQGGGQTATALVAAARQSARAAFCGMLGDDDLSTFTLSALETEGVDCSTVIHEPAARPFHAIVIIDSAERSRTILYSSEHVLEPDTGRINPEWIAQSRVIFTDQNTPRAGLWAAKLARSQGIPVVMDLEKTGAPELEELLNTIDHLIVGDGFARWYSGRDSIAEMMAALKRPQQAVLAITCGEQGCWYSEGGAKAVHVPAYRAPVVDTTGCGDVFHGTYAAAIARGESISRAIRIATVSAGIKASHAGGRPGIPDLPTVLEKIETLAE